jgi:hypothetical protein
MQINEQNTIMQKKSELKMDFNKTKMPENTL